MHPADLAPVQEERKLSRPPVCKAVKHNRAQRSERKQTDPLTLPPHSLFLPPQLIFSPSSSVPMGELPWEQGARFLGNLKLSSSEQEIMTAALQKRGKQQLLQEKTGDENKKALGPTRVVHHLLFNLIALI